MSELLSKQEIPLGNSVRGNVLYFLYAESPDHTITKEQYEEFKGDARTSWNVFIRNLTNSNHEKSQQYIHGSFIEPLVSRDDKNKVTLLSKWIDLLNKYKKDGLEDSEGITYILERLRRKRNKSVIYTKKTSTELLNQTQTYLKVLYLEDITSIDNAKSIKDMAHIMITKYKIPIRTKKQNKVSLLYDTIHSELFSPSKKGREAKKRGVLLTEEKHYRDGHKYVKYLGSETGAATRKNKVYYLTEEGQRFVIDNFPEKINTIRQQQKYIDHYIFKEPGHSAEYDPEQKKDITKIKKERRQGETKTYLEHIKTLPAKKKTDYETFKTTLEEISLEDPEYKQGGSNITYTYKIDPVYKTKIESANPDRLIKEPVFTISYKRADTACLNYRVDHFMGDNFDNMLHFLFIQEQDLEDYYTKWGDIGFIFVCISTQQEFTTEDFKDIGIGQTRRCLQVFAKEILKKMNDSSSESLQYYWSLDDNIPYFWKLKKDSSSQRMDDYEIIEEKGALEVMQTLKTSIPRLKEEKDDDQDVNHTLQKALIGIFQHRLHDNLSAKKITKDGPDIYGNRMYHLQKFLLINSDACYEKNIFYKGICSSDYRSKYSHSKEDVTFCEDLVEKGQLSIYKIYNFKYFGYKISTGGTKEIKFADFDKIRSELDCPPEDPTAPPPVTTSVQTPKETSKQFIPQKDSKQSHLRSCLSTNHSIEEEEEEEEKYNKIYSVIDTYSLYYKNAKKSSPFITKFEKTRIIGSRAEMLANGSKPTINVPSYCTDVLEIALLEYKQKKIPLFIVRKISDTEVEYWRLEDMVLL